VLVCGVEAERFTRLRTRLTGCSIPVGSIFFTDIPTHLSFTLADGLMRSSGLTDTSLSSIRRHRPAPNSETIGSSAVSTVGRPDDAWFSAVLGPL